MSQSELGSNNLSSNGTYKFDPGYTRFVLIGGGLALLFLLGPVIVAETRHEALPSGVMAAGVLAAAGLIAAMATVIKRSKRTVQINNEGIFVQNTRGDEIGSLRWSELAAVTATHKMAQLVLQDGAGNRRVVVDRNLENFQRIRGRILAEYAKVFTAAPLPIEFRRPNFWTADGIVSVGAAAVMGWVSLSIFRNGQPGSGVLLFCLFEIPISLYFLSINPQVLGASQLCEDRIELNGLLRRRVMYKKDVTGVEILDFTAGRSGTSSMVLVSAFDGRQLKILQRYGSLPEIYLTLRAWLAR